MNLPLFKGLSHEQVSSFLEKTHITFTKYSDQEKISSAGEQVSEVKCVISGQVRLIHKIGDSDMIVLSESRRGNEVLGADKLFGMDTSYGFDAYAIGNVSTMEFSKEQYKNQLNAGSIYLLNYLNFLSYRAQIRYTIFKNYPDGSLLADCARLIMAYCSKNSEDINLYFDKKSMAAFCNTDPVSLSEEIYRLENLGIIRQTQEGFSIVSKEYILNR